MRISLLLTLVLLLPSAGDRANIPSTPIVSAERAPRWPASRAARDTPTDVVQSLLMADRAYGAVQGADLLAAVTPMLSDRVMMPRPGGGFAIGRTEVLQVLAAAPGAKTAHVTWFPVRGGISADGVHGFTFGYMTQRSDSTRVPLKYLAYWVRENGVWRVLAYRRGRAAGPAIDTTMMTPALPARMMAVRTEPILAAQLRQELMRAESAFSARAQAIGLGNAFAEFGSADAVNMGGPQAAQFVVGAANIAQSVGGGDMTSSPVTWGADTAIVASSGDLGVTFGVIRARDATGGAGTPFFTIWRRATSRAPWRYIAE
jgi:hypothetical protein